MDNYTIYMHVSPSDKRYIGITRQKPEYRWERNGKGYDTNSHFWNAINKYGWDNFQHIIIARGLDRETAKWIEIELIREWDSTNKDKGYNITLGGDGGNGYKPTEEELKRMSERVKGENNPMYGILGEANPVSKPIVMFDKDGNMIKEFSCIREANSYFKKSRAFSYISRICIEEKGSAYGYLFLFKERYEEMERENVLLKWLDESIRMLGNANIRKDTECEKKNREVYQLEKSTCKILKKYNSCYEASKECSIRNVHEVARHEENRNTAGGFHWMFVDEYENLTLEEIKEIYKPKPKSMKGVVHKEQRVSVICLTTKQIFSSITFAQQYYEKKLSISAVCKGKRGYAGKTVDGKPMVWRYLIWKHDKRYRIKSSRD